MPVPKKSYQRFCRLCWWGGRCWRYAAKGSLKGATNWTIIGTGVLGFAAEWLRLPVSFGDGWQAAVLSGLLYMLIAWAVIFAGRLLISPYRLYNEGKWHGTRFVYREPKLAFHEFVSAANNNYAYNFYFLDAPPFCLVHFKIEVDGLKNHIDFALGAGWRQLPEFDCLRSRFFSKGSLRLTKDRRMWFSMFMEKSSDPMSIRIYVTGWDIGDTETLLMMEVDGPQPAFWGA